MIIFSVHWYLQQSKLCKSKWNPAHEIKYYIFWQLELKYCLSGLSYQIFDLT